MYFKVVYPLLEAQYFTTFIILLRCHLFFGWISRYWISVVIHPIISVLKPDSITTIFKLVIIDSFLNSFPIDA